MKEFGILITLLIFLMSFTTSSYAGDAKLTWVAPTQNEDGTAIPTTGTASLGGYKVYYSRDIGTLPTATPIVISDKNTLTYTVTNLPSGVHYFAVSAFTVGNVESKLSNYVSKDIQTIPNPPSGVTVESTVYNVVKRVNSFLLLPVGTIAANIPCNMAQSVNGYNVVPRENVIWSGTIKPDVVVAKCGQP